MTGVRVPEAVERVAVTVRRVAPGTDQGQVLLEVDLTQSLAAAPPPDLVGRLQAGRGALTLTGVLERLADATDDPSVVGLVAKVGGGRLRLAQAQEIALAVRAFRAKGKRTWAWAETFGETGPGTAGYVLASAFDEVWLQPSGDIGMTGVAIEPLFLRGVLDRAGIEPQFGQRYEFKNAVDLLLRRDFSEAHREASGRLATSALEQVVGDVAGGRGLSPDAVRDLVDQAPLSAAEALRAGLVDHLGYRHEVYAAARAAVGEDAHLRFLAAYRRRRPPIETLRRRRSARDAGIIALVHAVGEIRLGRSGRGLRGPALGSDTLTSALRAAASDDHVHAVLLRVDSPGGSYVASDTMWGALQAVKAAGKTVVVSMGAVAGSGGYFIAAPAHAIVALPATLTGSIGVFGGKPVVTDLLDRVGVGNDAVVAGRHARMFSIRARYTDEEWQRLQESLDRIYDDFVGKVAAGRGLDRERVHELARGRVWTGADARDRGLVDELGGLRRAAELTRERAGLPYDAPVRPFPHVPLVRRLRRPRSSEDPAAVAVATAALVPGSVGELATSLGLIPSASLLMPALDLR